MFVRDLDIIKKFPTNLFQIFSASALPEAISISSELNAKHRTSVLCADLSIDGNCSIVLSCIFNECISSLLFNVSATI